MAQRRKIEVFTAGCPGCAEAVHLRRKAPKRYSRLVARQPFRPALSWR